MSSFWGCAQTYSSQEFKAVEHLQRQGYTTFLPIRLLTDKYRHRKRLPLFPGYIFIQLAHDRPWRAVNATHGVIRLLTMLTRNELPAPCIIPDRFMASLQAITLESGEIPLGAHVRIISGPLCDRNAIIEWTDGERLGLLLQVLGREMIVEFGIDDVSRV